MTKKWLRITRKVAIREQELKENPWGSKIFFEELRRGAVTDRSEVYIYQREQRADGALYTPRRVTVNELLSADLAVLDEGDSFSSYLSTQVFNEGDSAETYTAEETYEEGNSATVYSLQSSFSI
jgi:hypothetical protein